MSTELTGLEGTEFTAEIRYRILEELGRGGMGVAYLALREAEGVGERVVLKTIGALDRGLEQQLAEEARWASALRHQNIVRTTGLVMIPFAAAPESLQEALREASLGDAPIPCIAMDYVDGVNLLELHLAHMRRGLLLPVMLSAYIISRLARALEVAHTRLVHRDVSAQNVLIGAQGVPMLTDFGAALARAQQDGGRVGKLAYMAPEVIREGKVSPASDIYSLGMMAYLLTCGMHVQGDGGEGSLEERCARVLRRIEPGVPPLHALCPDVPEVYSDLVARMIAADPDRRFARAGAVADAIEQTVLYARGFGPTYGSLAAYMEAFEADFEAVDASSQTQLPFLRNNDSRLVLRRRLASEQTFSQLGREWVAQQEGSPLHEAVFEAAHATEELASPAGRPMLKVRMGDGCVETQPLAPGVLSVGRGNDCDVVLADTMASRLHAELRVEGEGSWLTVLAVDKGSKTGTILDSRALEPERAAELRPGRRLRIGSTTLIYVHEPARYAPPDAIDNLPEEGPPAELLDRRRLALRFFCRNAPRLAAFLSQLGLRAGLAQGRADAFARGVIEACQLASEPERSLALELVRHRSRLEVTLYAPEGSRYLKKTLSVLKALRLGQPIESNDRSRGVQVLRQTFDRLDLDHIDRSLALTLTI